MTIKGDYTQHTCELSMPEYIEAALHLLQYPVHPRPEHSPHRHIEIQYGAPIQFTPIDDTSEPLDSDGITRVQQIVGILLHYGQSVDNTMLVALISLAAAQTKSTNRTDLALTKILNYATTHPDATIRYVASDIVLRIYSDVSYVSEPKSQSRVGGYFTLTSRSIEPSKPPATITTPNGPIHTVTNIMKHVMSYATKSEAGGLFHNTKDGAMLRTTLSKMGHPQPPTPIQTDNSNTTGIALVT